MDQLRRGFLTVATADAAYVIAPSDHGPVVPVASTTGTLLAAIAADPQPYRTIDDPRVLDWDPAALPALVGRACDEAANLLLLDDGTVHDADVIAGRVGSHDWAAAPIVEPDARYALRWDRWGEPTLQFRV